MKKVFIAKIRAKVIKKSEIEAIWYPRINGNVC